MSNEMSMDEMIEVLARYRYNAKHDADRIKALEDELGRMRADVDRLRDRYAEATQENARLKAEVEHLTSENLLVREEADRYCRLWQEAKEGKQS